MGTGDATSHDDARRSGDYLGERGGPWRWTRWPDDVPGAAGSGTIIRYAIIGDLAGQQANARALKQRVGTIEEPDDDPFYGLTPASPQ